jgi:hypothetical protein
LISTYPKAAIHTKSQELLLNGLSSTDNAQPHRNFEIIQYPPLSHHAVLSDVRTECSEYFTVDKEVKQAKDLQFQNQMETLLLMIHIRQ